MTSAGRNLLAMSAVFLLSACGLFGDDDEELKPAELIDTLMGKKAEHRFRFIQENAHFAEDLDI